MGTGMAGPNMASSLQQQHQHQQAQLQAMNLQSPSQSSTYGSGVTGASVTRHRPEQTTPPSADQFPKGLRVLVVDDDICCLKIVESMLKSCGYQVTTCALATKALELLKANKDVYDLVITDVHMPDMDGFKLLELVGLEMDLPVIMMSANGETPQVMKGVTHGACDYLIKPVRQLELKNIWQHVVRKKSRESSKEAEQSGSLEDGERHRRGGEDSEYTSSLNDAADGSWKLSKKRKDAKDDEEDEQDNEDPSTLKKPRVVWSVELHQQFVGAVNKLGIDKAVPKRILELMNVQGLTRENVASHLQKYRLYLKRLSGVTHQQGNPFGSPTDPFSPMSGLDGVGELRALAASGQLTPQALAALQANMLSRMNVSSNGVGMGGLDSSMLLHMSGANGGLLARPRLPQPVLNLQQSMLQGLPSPLDLDPLCQTQQMGLGALGQSPLVDDVAGLTALQHQLAAAGGLGGIGSVTSMNGNLSPNPSNNSLMLQLLQQQQQVQVQQLPQGQVGGSVNLQSGGLLPQHMQLTSANDINLGRAGPLSNMTAVNACIGNGMTNLVGASSRGIGAPVINTGSAMSNGVSSLARPPTMDSKLGAVQHFSGNNLSPSSPAGIASPSSMKDLSGALGNISDTLNCKPGRAIGTNFSALGNLGPGLLTSNPRPSWQNQGQDYGQPSSPLVNNPSPRYGHSNINGGFPRGQGFMGQGIFPGRLSVDTSGAISLSEQSTADSEMKMKDERAVDSIFSTRLDSGLLGNRDDDLLGMFMKQAPQEPLSFSESELDNFPLDNLYVK